VINLSTNFTNEKKICNFFGKHSRKVLNDALKLFLQGYDLFYNFLYFLKALWRTYVSLIITTLQKILPTSKKNPCCYWFLCTHFHQLKSINGKKISQKKKKESRQARAGMRLRKEMKKVGKVYVWVWKFRRTLDPHLNPQRASNLCFLCYL